MPAPLLMDFGPLTFALGYLAGVLSTLSPCVLPLLPILVATATAQHRLGPLALAAGLTLSFALVGVFIATIGISIGLELGVLRFVAALLLMLFGAAMLSSHLRGVFTRLTAHLTSAGDGWLARLSGRGWLGQFIVGLVLGVVWSPCVGPTLGAASALAVQGSQLPQVVALMLVFGLGAGTPLVLVGALSREVMARWRGHLLQAGQRGLALLGLVFVLLGVAIVSGTDKRIEAWVVDHSPGWLTELTTRY